MARDDSQEVIFEVGVDYADRDRSIRADGDNNRRIEDIVVRTLTVDLPQELERVFDVKAEIIIKGTRYGSLIVFFTAAVTAYGVLSGYKGLLESVELIRDQARDLIKIALSRVDEFNVSVSARYPRMEYFEPGMFRRLRRFMQSPMEEELVGALAYGGAFQRPQRDGFFYFLLAFSILELVVIAVLVGGAVIDKYF